jgi:uncharacterized protein
MIHATFLQMKKQLGQVEKWFDAAAEHAKAKNFDPNVLVTQRLAPDQFAFARQVQTMCDTAKLAASRLSGKEAPVQADTEATMDELRARIRSVIAYLDGFTEKDFAEAASKTITQPRWEGKKMAALDYFREHAVPNFYFHLTHVYAILRHNGVSVGKRDYLGALTFS